MQLDKDVQFDTKKTVRAAKKKSWSECYPSIEGSVDSATLSKILVMEHSNTSFPKTSRET